MTTDEKFMSRCIELARRGLGSTYPNPLVGSVIVHNGIIIGEGYHQKYGGPHAEVNAVNAVENKDLLKESTIYVTLEPCAHFGKTPPCADLIIEKQIPKVVVGIVDPFAQVCGEGIKKMRDKGIEVVIGVLEKECTDLNKRFLWNVKTDLPYIILKWAETKDGFVDQDRDSQEQKINWITSSSTKAITHTWRREEAGILVGVNTILNDNPELTVREVEGRNPVRIIIDSQCKTGNAYFDSAQHKKCKIFELEGTNLVYNQVKSFKEGNTEYIQLENFSLKNILKDLKQRNISSILVEGGSYTLNQFIQENLWNEARVYRSHEVEFKSGLQAPTLSENLISSTESLENEDLFLFENIGLLDSRSKS